MSDEPPKLVGEPDGSTPLDPDEMCKSSDDTGLLGV